MKILFIRFSSIGDIVLTTSPLRSLKKGIPNAQIHYLTLEEYAPLLEGNSSIDRLHVLVSSASVFKLISVGNYLNHCNFDVVVDMHDSLRSKIIRNRIKSGTHYYLKKPRWKRFKLFEFHQNDFQNDFSQLTLFHSVIKDILPQEYHSSTSLFVSENEKEEAKLLLSKNGIKGEQYLVCIPGASWRNKTWGTDSYLELFKYFMKNKFKIILLGTEKDVICNECALENNSLINMAGKTEFRQSLAIISQAQLVIGSDTGFVHAAEALGIPAVMLLGPTSTETGAGVTRSMSKNIQLSHIWCRPCSQNGSRPCYRYEKFCMNGIQPDSVISQIANMI